MISRRPVLVDDAGLAGQDVGSSNVNAVSAAVPLANARKWPRADLSIHVPIYDLQASATGLLRDISERGLGVAGIESSVGQTKTFQIPIDTFMQADPLLVVTKCKWVKTEGKNRGYPVAGFEIMDLPEQDKNSIREFIKSLLLSKGGPESSVRCVSQAALLRDLLNSEQWRVRFLGVYDAFVAGLALAMGYTLSPAYQGIYQGVTKHADAVTMIPIFAATFLLMAFAWGMYESKCLESVGTVIIPVACAVTTTWGLLILVGYTLTYSLVGRWIVAISAFGLYGAAVLPRIVLHLYTNESFKRIIVIGTEHDACLIDAAARERGDRPVRIVQVLQGKSRTGASGDSNTNLRDLCLRYEVDLVVADERCDDETLAHLAACLQTGTQVCGFCHYYEHMFHKVPAGRIDVDWILSANLHHRSPWARVLKRGADLFLAGIGFVVAIPLWPVIAILVKATSKGPIFYTQHRVGQGGKVFSLIKFRTMCNEAEIEGCAVWASEDDPRVTLVGRILRKTRLDEIPQFLNVLNGDMSFVGPRPERPEFVGRLQETIPHYGLRHIIKPGITGWAQIMYPYGASEADAKEKLCYDLYYVKYGNLTLDLKILVRTLGKVMKGAR